MDIIAYTLITLGAIMLVLIFAGRRFSKKLGSGGRKRWLVLHIIFVLIYFSGVSGQTLIHILSSQLANLDTLRFTLELQHQFDNIFIIPGAFGTVITGTWLCVRTSWGISRYYWIICKWAGTIIIVVLGIWFIGLTLMRRLPAVFEQETAPLQSQAYAYADTLLYAGQFTGLCMIITLTVLSYLKPKKQRKLPL